MINPSILLATVSPVVPSMLRVDRTASRHLHVFTFILTPVETPQQNNEHTNCRKGKGGHAEASRSQRFVFSSLHGSQSFFYLQHSSHDHHSSHFQRSHCPNAFFFPVFFYTPFFHWEVTNDGLGRVFKWDKTFVAKSTAFRTGPSKRASFSPKSSPLVTGPTSPQSRLRPTSRPLQRASGTG